MLQNAEAVIKNELNRFQERLQRCSQICQDEVSDQISSNMDRNSPKFQSIEKKVNGCISVCVDKHIALLKPMQSKLKADLDELVKQNSK